jgi:hypothetical protein
MGLMRATMAGLAGALLLASATVTARAQMDLVDPADPQSVVNAMQANGYKAVLSFTAAGKPKIDSAISRSKVTVLFNDCRDNANCKSIQFYVGYNVRNKPFSIDKVNEWNQTKRWAKAYIDREGDPVLEMDVNMIGGISGANFADTIDWWRLALTEYEKFIGW